MKIGATIEAVTGRLVQEADPQAVVERLFSGVIQIVREYRLQLIEFPMDARFIYPSLLTEESLALVHRLAQENSFGFTVHLPYMWLDLSSINEEMREASVGCVLQGLELGRILNPFAYPLHLSGEQSGGIATSDWEEKEKQTFLRRMVEQAGRSLAELAQAVEPEKLCVENSSGMPVEPIVSLVREQGVSLCLDVGHLMLQGRDPVAFIQAHFDIIRAIHLHDVARLVSPYRGSVLKDHQSLGSGFVPVREIVATLRSRSYEGALIVEMMRRDRLEDSLEVLRGLLGE